MAHLIRKPPPSWRLGGGGCFAAGTQHRSAIPQLNRRHLNCKCPPACRGGELDRDLLAKCLGQLGSDNDGIVLNAARAVEKMRRDAGLRWAEIVSVDPREPHHEVSADELLDLCVRLSHLLSWRESCFVFNMRGRGQYLTAKQHRWLVSIAARVRAERAA